VHHPPDQSYCGSLVALTRKPPASKSVTRSTMSARRDCRDRPDWLFQVCGDVEAKSGVRRTTERGRKVAHGSGQRGADTGRQIVAAGRLRSARAETRCGHHSLALPLDKGEGTELFSLRRERFYLFGLTTSTGHKALRTTSSATLPNRKCVNPDRPWLAITTKSIPNSLIASRIPLFAIPSFTTTS